MGVVTRRLNALWLRQTCTPYFLSAKTGQPAAMMLLKVNEPLRIGRRALPPGTYVLRPSEAGGDRDSAQILNADQTELIATISSAVDH